MDDSPLLRLPRTAETHFNLYLHAAIVAVITQVAREHDSAETAFERFPFLAGYVNQLVRHGLDGVPLGESMRAWRDVLRKWEEGVDAHLPLRALRRAYGLSPEAMEALMAVGLVEEDARFVTVFAALSSYASDVRARWRELDEVGLIEFRNKVPHVPVPIWAALSGDVREAVTPWARYSPPTALRDLEALVLPDAAMEFARRLPALLGEGTRALVVRGARHNGRGTLVGAVAKAMGRGLLRVDCPGPAEEARHRTIGVLAVALHAVPLMSLEPAPGETLVLPQFPGLAGPMAILLGAQGGIDGPPLERSITLRLELPGEAARIALWRGAGCEIAADAAPALARRHRIASGNIHRIAALSKGHAALDGRTAIEPRDVEAAASSLNREALDTLATAVPVRGSWSDLVVDAHTAGELAALEARCRHRERLPALVGKSLGAHVNPGVRIMLKGPSGCGKTHCAKTLAAVLNRNELYCIDLSAVTNKYLGESEKSLNRAFDRAEELDVILLLDEGDGILGRRTAVSNSNDRHANDLTNFVLQKLEAFTGIFVVTTNAPDLVDPAFRRRMDVVIDFPTPRAEERLAIFQLHLPAHHGIDPDFLEEVAYRCALTGGQIRNVVLHASLIALDRGSGIETAELEAAVQREYRKSGAVCPLRARHPAAVAMG